MLTSQTVKMMFYLKYAYSFIDLSNSGGYFPCEH